MSLAIRSDLGIVASASDLRSPPALQREAYKRMEAYGAQTFIRSIYQHVHTAARGTQKCSRQMNWHRNPSAIHTPLTHNVDTPEVVGDEEERSRKITEVSNRPFHTGR